MPKEIEEMLIPLDDLRKIIRTNDKKTLEVLVEAYGPNGTGEGEMLQFYGLLLHAASIEAIKYQERGIKDEIFLEIIRTCARYLNMPFFIKKFVDVMAIKRPIDNQAFSRKLWHHISHGNLSKNSARRISTLKHGEFLSLCRRITTLKAEQELPVTCYVPIVEYIFKKKFVNPSTLFSEMLTSYLVGIVELYSANGGMFDYAAQVGASPDGEYTDELDAM